MPFITTLRKKGLSRLLTGGGLFFVLAAPVQAIDQDLVIDETRIPAPVLSVLFDLLQRDDPGLTESHFIDSVSENHVLADYLRAQNLTAIALGDNPVGFSPKVQHENRLVSTLRAAYAAELAQAAAELIDSNPMSMLDSPLEPATADLKALLQGGTRVIYQLSDDEMQSAGKLHLGHYRLPGDTTATVLTLADIYQRQNVQGRIALHEGETGWLQREVHLYLAQRFVLWWARQRSPLRERGVNAMAMLIEDQMLRQGWLAHSGVSAEIHAGNPALKARAQLVSDKEILRWYEAHQDRFREVSKVTVWQAQCQRRQDCDQVAEALRQGADFSQVAQQFSTRLGMSFSADPITIRRGQGQLSWRDAVALMQSPDEIAPPVHAPGGELWYLFQVLEQGWHQYPAHSDTVRAVARREIAQQALIDDYQSLRDKLLTTASIQRPAP